MPIRPFLLLAVVALLCGGAAPMPPACERVEFEGEGFTVCAYRAGQDELRLELLGPHGPLGSLPALKLMLGEAADRVRFAMNGGMYHPGQAPVGLLVQAGVELAPADVTAGSGNFYALPNGVFWVGADGAAHVEETKAFVAAGRKAVWATQSGPLMLAAGVLHPIATDRTRLVVRNGVGVCADGTAKFAISDGGVTIGRFARLFRDGLGCPDALYLDGSVSALWAPEMGRLDDRRGLGPLVVVLAEP